MKVIKILVFFVIILSSQSVYAGGVSGDWSCNAGLDDSIDAVHDLGVEMEMYFPFSLLITAKDIMEDLMSVTALSMADYNYTLWGTTYYPLYFLSFPSFDYFMIFVRWVFLVLVIVRISINLIGNLI